MIEWFVPQTVRLTLGVLTVIEKGGALDRGGGRNSSLFTWFRACMFVFRGNSRTFRVAAIVSVGFCMVILGVSGSSTSLVVHL